MFSCWVLLAEYWLAKFTRITGNPIAFATFVRVFPIS
jgi:hypothetical protein